MITSSEVSAFWQDGFAIIPNVIPQSLCEAVIADIVAATGIKTDDPSTWYQPNFAGHGIVPVHHTQAMWDVRQHPNLHSVFSALYGTPALWVTMDRLSYKPPASQESRQWRRAEVHWDCDPWRFRGRSIQGLVYLTETSSEQGSFACAPEIYRNLTDYLEVNAGLPEARKPALDDRQLHAVAGGAGSLVVFSRLMPHTSLLNHSPEHRFVQYVTMQPVADSGGESERVERVTAWQNKMPPQWAVAQKVAGQQIPEPGSAATLTALGNRLVGVDAWP